MVTLLVLLLIVSPVSSFVMLYNQRQLEKQVKNVSTCVDTLREMLIITNDDLKSLSKTSENFIESI